MQDYAAHAVLSALNHLLAGAGWARQRLSPFAGRTLRLAAVPLQLVLSIDDDGYFTASAAEDFDVTIDLPAITPWQLLAGPEAALREARIAGAADFAETLGFVLRNLRWDHEEDLSRLVGDVAAHRLSTGLGQLLRWQRQAGRNLAENLVEYYRDEQHVLTSPASLQHFAADVARLHGDIAALEQRLKRRVQR
jgi:ubiquinone biosynthesis protein UbiJ